MAASDPLSPDELPDAPRATAPASADAVAAFIDGVLARLAEDKRVQRSLPGGGEIHLDRRLPFLCVYRRAEGDDVAAGEQLVTAETAYVIAPADSQQHQTLTAVVRRLAETLALHFGSFLIVEVWAGADYRPSRNLAGTREKLPPKPGFDLHVRGPRIPRKTIEALSKALGKLKLHKQAPEVKIHERAAPHPTGLKPLLKPAEARQIGCHVIGLEVRPIYREPGTSAIYPAVLRTLRRGLAQALKQAFFTFARNRTNIRPEHYNTFGRRTVVKLVWEVDQQLAVVGDSFDLLLQTTPVNAEAAWREFSRKQFEQAPAFHYRPLAVEPSLLKRKLFAIPIERIADPTLAFLFRQKQDELDRKITMLTDIGTSRFLPESMQIFGRVSEPLLRLAEGLLERIATHGDEESLRGQLPAGKFALRAQQEIDYYRQRYADFAAEVHVRDDMYTGLLVSGRNLLIGGKTRVPARRVEALLQHEIGTHLVTYFNGRAQPFRLLDLGLAGYDGLQEGLAVLSEFLVGGLSRPRMRLLAARVVAAQALTQGASFVETFRLLQRTHEFTERTAYTITMRVYRGGGLTKDMVYLQGLVQILDYLKTGGDVEPLLIGKIAADHIPLIGELRIRGVLHAPPLRPRYLEDPQAVQRLDQVRGGMSVLDLVEATA